VKVTVLKTAGGNLFPATDEDADKLTRFKTGEHYEIEIKLSRNPAFLRKVMAFFKFCFEYWDGESVLEYTETPEQFDRFRKDLTILAGFYVQTTRLNGDTRLEAESLSFASMSEERFQQCYIALTNAAMRHIFKTADELTYNKLIGFF
jgi:hypothetical protein